MKGRPRLAFVAFLALGTCASVATAAGNDSALVDAARRGDSAAVRTLVQRKADVNSTSIDGTTALHWAAQLGDFDTVTLLLKNGAKADVPNRYGATPLRGACVRGDLRVVEALLKAGADPNRVREESGDTPLMMAARSGHADVVKTLLAHGAKAEVTEPLRKQTALMWAAAEHHPDVVKVLLEAGADPNALSSTKITPLMFAIRAGDLESTRLFLDAGQDINAVAADGTRMLTFAILNARLEIAKYLIERGVDLKAKDPHGTPFQVLTFMRRADNVALATVLPRQLPQTGVDAFALAKVMLAHGVDINERYAMPGTGVSGRVPNHIPLGQYRLGFSGATPFFVAAVVCDVPWMRFLAANGADTNIPTLAGITPLLGASGLGHFEGETQGTNAEALEAIKAAAELGNDPKAIVQAQPGEKPDVQFDGATAMHGAATRGSEEMVIWLASKGVPLDAKTKRGQTPYQIATATGLAQIPPEVPARILALAKERGETIDTTPPPTRARAAASAAGGNAVGGNAAGGGADR